MPTRTEYSPANEDFRSGGDVLLCSLGGVEFSVHNVVPFLASPVLAQMFYDATKKAVVNFAETSEMLDFRYPRSLPLIPSFEHWRRWRKGFDPRAASSER
ncbi:hypothetical protein FS749_008489 [Ceratobasidium sp. UAMH 11750]|nr:hypothetical protein FS749_008489 [Ceratobasidium sp. UAMH 11750]